MTRKLQINGKSLRTQQAYTRAVRQLVEHHHKAPEAFCESELQDYFLFHRNTSQLAPKTLRICYTGIKFYYQFALQRDWKLFAILRTQKERRLPCVLSNPVALRILAHVRTGIKFKTNRDIDEEGDGMREWVSPMDSGDQRLFIRSLFDSNMQMMS